VERETVVITRVVTRVITRVVTPVERTPVPSPPKDQVILCVGQEPTTLDPLLDASETGFHLRGLWGGDVLFLTPENTWQSKILQHVPDWDNGGVVLTGPEGPDGTLQITFRLRPGWQWEDGTPLTPQDFLTAWEWARAGRGTPEVQALAADVTTMRVLDDTSWQVTLRQGLMTPLYLKYLFGPYPAAWQDNVEAMPPVNATEWPSFGPYRLISWTKGQEARWEVNPYYALRDENLPYLRRVIVRFLAKPDEALVALLSGRCDLLLPDVLPITAMPLLEEARRQQIITLQSVTGPAWEHLDFNTWPPDGRTPFFADARVRRAVAFALDRAAMVEQATFRLSRPMRSWLSEDHWAYQPLPPLAVDAYDPERARALLADVGWRDEDGDGVLEAYGVQGTFWDGTAWQIEDGVPFEVTLVTAMEDPIHAAVARQVRQDLQAIGIRVNVQSIPAETIFAPESPVRRRQFDLALFAWVPDVDVGGRYLWVGNAICRRADGTLYAAPAGYPCEPDDETLYEPQIPTPENNWQGGNVSGWADPQASLAVYQATSRLQPTDRAPFYVEHQMRFAEMLPVVPLFQRPQLWAWRVGLQGPQPGPYTPITWNIERWRW